MEKMKIIRISIDDWTAIYGPDGKCFKQGHTMKTRDLFNLLQTIDAHPKDIEYIVVYQDKLAKYAKKHGKLPSTLKKCKKIIHK